MFAITPLQLARIQFGFTVSFHIIFPAITIGLASYLVVLEALWLWRKDEVYRTLYHFWSRIFAVNFAMGVVSGLVMAYEFGTNWSHFSAAAGSITGPLLAYEVLTAFFWKPDSSASCCLAGTRWDPACISSLVSWSRSARSSQRLGFSLRTAGCRRLRALRSSMAGSCLSIG